VPLVATLIPARLLDRHLGTSPWIMVVGFFISFHLTLVILLFMLRGLFAELGEKKK